METIISPRECVNSVVPRTIANITANDGLLLASEHFGSSADPPVLFTHGFGQNRHAWSASASHLAERAWHAITVDGRGHGDSQWQPDGNYDLNQFADDLALIARQQSRPPVLVGASMGGLLAMLTEAENGPNLFRALVLVDITPRWESKGVERILDFMRAHPDGFASLDDAAGAIAGYLPQRRERKSPARLKQLLVKRADGRYRWHWDPRLLDRVAADGERYQARLLAAARQISIPTLLVSGEQSDIVSQSTINEFLGLVPHARHVIVPKATHMVAGDSNDAFADTVFTFLQSLHSDATH
jgi:pimeloyl-ACP methyl ester carboxylesterase